jgi:polyphenol oxidase
MHYLEVDQLKIGQFGIMQGRDGIKHGVSTRVDGLDLRNAQGVDTGRSRMSRERFLNAMGLEYQRAVWGRQVHGSHVAIVDAPQAPPLQNTDALVTNLTNVPLMVAAADCVPILLWDPQHRAIGAVHAGWRGTVQRIVQKAVAAMEAAFGSSPSDILAGLGPAIGPCCYEVGDAVLAPLRESFPTYWQQMVVSRGDAQHLDLWMANSLQLQEQGIAARNIEEAQLCTSCHTNLYYSERKEGGSSGRFVAAISLL